MKNKTSISVSAGIIFLVLVIATLWRHNPASTPSIPSNPPVESASAPIENPPPLPAEAPSPSRSYPTYQWNVGDRAAWQFGLSMRIPGSPESMALSGETRVGGRLQCVVLHADAQKITLGAALSDPWFSMDGQRVPRYEELFKSTPAILTLTPEGALLDLALPKEIPAEDRNTLRLVYAWEFVARNAQAYQQREQSPDGGSQFRADYTRPDAMRIHKTRVFQPDHASPDDAMQHVVSSDFNGTVGNLWFREMSGFEDTVVYLNGAIFAASRISVSFKEETNSVAWAPGLIALQSNAGAAAGFSTRPDPVMSSQTEGVGRAVRREALASRWQAVPYDQVFMPLLAQSGATLRELEKPLKDFENWMLTHPDEGPMKVLQSLQALPADQSMTSSLLINGLVEADTAQSREALSTLLDAADAFPPSSAIQAAVAAGDLGEKSSLKLKQTLARLMDSPLTDGDYRMSDTALFAFARIAKEDVQARDYLLQRTASWLEDNAAPQDAVTALNALANAGAEDPLLLQQAGHFARSTDANVRLAAVEYFGSLPATSAGRAMVEPLGSDPDERIRTEVERIRSLP